VGDRIVVEIHNTRKTITTKNSVIRSKESQYKSTKPFFKNNVLHSTQYAHQRVTSEENNEK
jgi:hypothetical protein